MTKHLLLLTCAVGAISSGVGVAAASAADTTSPSATEVGAVIVTAEKRQQNIQKVPVAVTAFTTKQRDLVGIENLQDMTNFTPGLVYSSVLDRVTLRGVGRQTNLLSADAAVTTYVDGFFTTSAVEASKPPMFVSNIEVLRGPQGTLQGRNAIGGALLVTTARPSSTPHSEGRITVGNYGYNDIEAYVTGPLADGLNFRLQGYTTHQTEGYFTNLAGGPTEGNVLDQWYIEPSISAKLGDHADLYVKAFAADWNNRGGPGARSDYTTGNSDFQLNGAGLGYNFNPGAAFNPLESVAGSLVQAGAPITNNPTLSGIHDFASTDPLTVKLRNTYDIDTEFTYHLPGFDIKYTGGFQEYKYDLNLGAVGGGTTSVPGDVTSFQTCYSAFFGTNTCGPAGPLTVFPAINYHYQENNQWFSHEITLASTGNSAFQWIAGLYYYDERYSNPIVTTNPDQPQMANPIYPYIGNAPANPNNWISYDNYIMETRSEAAYGQIDWKFTDTLKLTLGARYTQDHKDGTEYNRVVLFGGQIVQGLPAGFSIPGVPPYFLSPYGLYVDPAQYGNGAKAIDLTPNTIYGNPLACLPYAGVTSPCKTNATTGITSRGLGADFSSPTGTAGIEWTPTDSILAYARYSRGYKSGGFDAGTIASDPEVAPEHVNAYEVGYKQTFGRNLVVDADLYYYDFQDAQYVVSIFVPNFGPEGLLTNIPKARVDGFELESIWTPIDHLQFDLSYSLNDTSVQSSCTATTSGGITTPHGLCLEDTSDPLGLSPHARTVIPVGSVLPTGTSTVALQTISGNQLPNAPRNKIALNGNYTFVFDAGSLTLSATGIWRDQQYGSVFKEPYDVAPSWSQVDLRAVWKAPDDKYEIILYGRNVFNTVGYEAAAGGGIINTGHGPLFGAAGSAPYAQNNLYGINPPATYGIEVHYKFF